MILAIALSLLIHTSSNPQVELLDGHRLGMPFTLEASRIGGVDLDGKPLALEYSAAIALRAMRQKMAAQGLTLDLNYAHRSMEQQRSLYRRSKKLAGKPGRSPHQEGIAIDVAGCSIKKNRKRYNTSVCKWLNKHANEFGFYQTLKKKEPWHWEYRGSSPLSAH
jgi:LAS superfamily LD-carboxypeptidase LdcB